MNSHAARFAIALGVGVLATAGAMSAVSQDQSEQVREERTVVVQGARETWQLVWEGKPQSVCGPEEVSISITCPCSGFAYGERGKLALVRRREGHEIERMDLSALFNSDYIDFVPVEAVAGPEAVLKKWPVRESNLKDSDLERDTRGDSGLVEEIRHRRPVSIIHPADYDRDGEATEFLLQVATMPCGKHLMALVGVSESNPHLHAFGGAGEPGKPLLLMSWVWSALLKGHGKAEVIAWSCGDHGSEVESRVRVAVSGGSFTVKRWDRKCGTEETMAAPFDQTPVQ